MFGYSTKAWVLAVGTPVVAFIWASIIGGALALAIVLACAECRSRYAKGARGREIILFHHHHGGEHDR